MGSGGEQGGVMADDFRGRITGYAGKGVIGREDAARRIGDIDALSYNFV